MKTYRYENATIHVEGDFNIDKVKKYTELFLRKVIKELDHNADEDKARTIEEQQVLDK